MKKIGIIGYGWLGERLESSLSGKYTLATTTTTESKVNLLNNKGIHAVMASFPDYQLTEPLSQWGEVKNMEVLIITIPVSEKSCCVSSLYNRIQNLSAFIGDFKGQMFLMSSTGVYPDIAKEFTEEDVPLEKISGERMLRNKYPQLNILRLGGLMGDNRLLKNYNVGNLDHAVNHIHYADISRIISEMIKQKSESKLYNVTAPVHPAKSQVINAQKNLLDEEEFEVKGKKVLSSKLVSELNYTFQYPDPRSFHL
ncbi:hypothetical protein A1704_02845 [Chryseobacterium cucumeris]|uniref:hypothetical protein n=1 Tax=Chryseobacterium cucumeris TaxID=1813611 RepID=UPI0007873FC0|nr:hypothetical protein [Chryseobacterium cucumeris]KYH07629.1 hypothetical protein A1704_02845 [Chryseobacterium cucumeris]